MKYATPTNKENTLYDTFIIAYAEFFISFLAGENAGFFFFFFFENAVLTRCKQLNPLLTILHV